MLACGGANDVDVDICYDRPAETRIAMLSCILSAPPLPGGGTPVKNKYRNQKTKQNSTLTDFAIHVCAVGQHMQDLEHFQKTTFTIRVLSRV